jgi:hypothetical protein
MIVTFKQIGINLRDYNGLTIQEVHPLIVNRCADYILSFEGDYDYEIFTHYNWQINYTTRSVYIPHNALIN